MYTKCKLTANFFISLAKMHTSRVDLKLLKIASFRLSLNLTLAAT